MSCQLLSIVMRKAVVKLVNMNNLEAVARRKGATTSVVALLAENLGSARSQDPSNLCDGHGP
jgi:hypothetical protein